MTGDGLSNGCSTIGISKMPPVEVMEQRYPLIFDEFMLHEASGGAGEHRGGFGVRYTLRMRNGSGKASFMMDHGKYGHQAYWAVKTAAPITFACTVETPPTSPLMSRKIRASPSKRATM